MKTLLVTIAIVVAGIAYAGDLDPPKGPVAPTMHTLDEIYNVVTNPPCCSPRPEDIRHYFVCGCNNCRVPLRLIIPTVEGTNGFVITDFVVAIDTIDSAASPRRVRLFEDGVQIAAVSVVGEQAPAFSANFTSGIPVAVGSTITYAINSSTPTDVCITLSGYVY